MMRISISWSACVAVGLGLLVLPLKWLLAGLLAATVHELMHILALACRGKSILSLSISHMGAKLETEPLDPKSELFCALAGPAGGLCLLIFLRPFPELALCALVQSVYNLLPFPGMDGGRCVHALLVLAGVLCVQVWQNRIASAIRWTATLVLLLFSLAAGEYGHTVMILALAAGRCIIRKTSCKDSIFAVQ
jgi:Zn-dependent protease